MSTSPKSLTPAPLLITEILLQIFAELFNDCCTGGRAALVAFACVSKSFSTPALDVLWSAIFDFVPLARCLAVDLCEVECDPETLIASVKWFREPSDDDFSRFVFYARRIKSIGVPYCSPRCDCHRTPYCYIEPDFFVRLASHSQVLAALPAVKRLYWWDSNILQFAPLFVGGVTTSLSLALRSPAAETLSFLEKLASLKPPLTEFDITHIDDYGPHSHAIMAALSSVILQLHSLASVRLPTSISFEALEHIVQSSTLAIADLWTPVPIRTACLPPQIGATSSSCLKMLRLNLVSMEACLPLIKATCTASLEGFRVGFKTVEPKSLESIFRLLGRQCGPNLQSIRIEHDWPLPETPMDYTVDASTISYLLPLRNIHTLVLDIAVSYEIDDHLLYRMAVAWPRLKWLRVCSDTSLSSARVTLEGLRTLVEYCPYLESLAILVDATVLPDVGAPKRPIAPNVRVTELDVGRSPIADPAGVADAITDMLPAVHSIWHTWEPREAPEGDGEEWARYGTLWDEAEVLVKSSLTFQDV